MNSLNVGICEVSQMSDLKIYRAHKIKNKACLLIHKAQSYIIPLLHH